MAAVEDRGGGGNEYGSNGAGVGGTLQGSFSDGADIRERKLDGYRGHVKITGGISSGIQKDLGDDGSAYYRQRMGMSPSGQRAKERRAFSNQGIHPLEAGHFCGAGGMSFCI